MYRRKSTEKWTIWIPVITSVFFIFVLIALFGSVYLIVGEIGEITARQRNLLLQLSGKQPVQTEQSSEKMNDSGFISFSEFMKYQKNTDQKIKSLRYELERLQTNFHRKANPL